MRITVLLPNMIFHSQLMQERVALASQTALRNILLHANMNPPIGFLSLRFTERPRMKFHLQGIKCNTQRPLPASCYEGGAARRANMLPLHFLSVSSTSYFPSNRDLSNFETWTATTRPWNSSDMMRLLELQNVTGMRQPLSSMQALWRLR